MTKPRAGELCAGYGGLALAVEEVFDAETAWVSEFDAAPSKILARHWPYAPNYGDMTKIKWAPDCPKCGTMCSVYRDHDDSPFYWCGICGVDWDISIRHDDPEAHLIPEPAEVMSGGTPCQDLSAAGRRAGMTEGTRSNLWVNMREAIAIQRPKYVVWENVRGAYSAEASSSVEQCPGCVGDTSDGRVFLRALGRVLGDLTDLGYDTQWRGLRAADVGACHSRYRVFVLAVDSGRVGRRESDLPAGLRATGNDRAAVPNVSNQGHLRPESPALENALRSGGGRRPLIAGDGRLSRADAPADRPDHRSSEPRTTLTAPTPDAHSGHDDGRLDIEKRCTLDGTPTARCGQVTRADIFAGRWCACEPPTNSQSVGWGERRTEPEGLQGGSHVALSGDTDWGEYEPAIRRWERTIGRPAPGPTEPTGRNNGHRLSPRFTEWMMGLPDGWVTAPELGISRNEQLKACGNGVVPQQAMAALRDMLAAFQTVELAA